MFENNTVNFYTLGCKLNFAETSTISRDFRENGFKIVSSEAKADISVINTCSVTDHADKKCRQLINKITRLNPNTFVVVVGCYAQLKPEEITKISGVNLVLGTKDKFNILKFIQHKQQNDTSEFYSCDIESVKDFSSSYSYGDRTRCFLKVQDGCDYKCSYCTIPKARGGSRNDSIENTIKEAKKVAESGIKEIILTGVNVGDFGRSTNENFIDLLKELEKVEGIERIRISSIEPNLLTDEIIDFVANSKKFLPHFHIPLQSGCNEVLKLMRRRYNTELFKHKIELIKQKMPNAFIGVDVITGTRGETEEYFNLAYNFIKGLDISFLHIFPYSERANTDALNIEYVVPISERKERAKRLKEISDKKHLQFYKNNIGNISNVLFEDYNNKGKIYGFTENYIKVEADYCESLINKIVEVTIIGISDSGTAIIKIN